MDKTQKNFKHFHAHLEIFYYESCDGIFEYGNKQHPIKSGDYIIVNSNCTHIQFPIDTERPSTFYVLSIDNVNLQGLSPNSLSHEGIIFLNFENPDNIIHNNLKLLFNELQNKEYDYRTKAIALFYEILVDTIRLIPKSSSSSDKLFLPNSEIINNLKAYIDAHFMEDITLDSLAKKSYMNKSYFLKQFKKNMNISPMRYLMQVRLQHAQLLLTKSDLSISEIAMSLQFNNISYFSEMFKQNFDMTPTDFRKFIKGSIIKGNPKSKD